MKPWLHKVLYNEVNIAYSARVAELISCWMLLTVHEMIALLLFLLAFGASVIGYSSDYGKDHQ